MLTFFIGLAVLIFGGLIYGRFCESIVKPTDRKTPAVEKFDGVDFVPMKTWKNSLIELLNIAGTGPILGPIQGILFGPIAFITIPIGCVLGGAMHDYMTGMISLRSGGEQMPSLIKRYLGKPSFIVYNIFIALLMLLVGAAFIYTPGDLFISHIIGAKSTVNSPVTWIVYGVIFIYYIIATLLPIDKIIGRVYPIFGAVLLLSALGVFMGLFFNGYKLTEIWESGVSFTNPYGDRFIPIFFVTVACGVVSGFHSTQATLISRTLKSERSGRMTFYNMMLLEGFIAMVWAAAAMGAVNKAIATNDMLNYSAIEVVGIVAKDMLGSVGGMIAIIGIIVLPITTGDTALRSLRVMAADVLKIDSGKKKNNLLMALPIFAAVAVILYFAKSGKGGFSLLWRYLSWANESIVVFAFSMISLYMMKRKMPYLIALIPGAFYLFVVLSYILSAPIGFNLPWFLSYIISGAFCAAYAALLISVGKKRGEREL